MNEATSALMVYLIVVGFGFLVAMMTDACRQEWKSKKESSGGDWTGDEVCQSAELRALELRDVKAQMLETMRRHNELLEQQNQVQMRLLKRLETILQRQARNS